MLDDKTTQAIMDHVMLGYAKPETVDICSFENFLTDEHDSSNTVVVRLHEDGRLIRFSFRFNFAMRDSEVLDYRGIREVKELYDVVVSSKYVELDDVDPAMTIPTVAGTYISKGKSAVLLDGDGKWYHFANPTPIDADAVISLLPLTRLLSA